MMVSLLEFWSLLGLYIEQTWKELDRYMVSNISRIPKARAKVFLVERVLRTTTMIEANLHYLHFVSLSLSYKKYLAIYLYQLIAVCPRKITCSTNCNKAIDNIPNFGSLIQSLNRLFNSTFFYLGSITFQVKLGHT